MFFSENDFTAESQRTRRDKEIVSEFLERRGILTKRTLGALSVLRERSERAVIFSLNKISNSLE